MSEQLPFGLSAQEFRVAELAARGLPLDDVAKQVGLSKGMVKVYLSRDVYTKCGVRSQVGLWMETVERRGDCRWCMLRLITSGHPKLLRGHSMSHLARWSHKDCCALTFITEEARASGILHRVAAAG
jgi:DNA-binding CsgD family transcriptional regulator